MVILAIVHLFQVFLFGAYKKPREVNWWTGVVLFLITFALALTGYLLPWDQRGYWSTRVVTNIVGTMPLIGPALREILVGGKEFGSTTLTHFYGFHILVLPALFILVIFGHILLFRKHGVTPTWRSSDKELEAKSNSFWPRQVFYDLVFSLLILMVLAAWTLYQKGAPLGPPADPVSNYLARPEWYFLFLFQALKYFKGEWEVVGILIFPLSILVFLLILPLIDRGTDRNPRVRKTLFLFGGIFSLFLVALTLIALYEDKSDPIFFHQKMEGERQAQAALRLAQGGIPPEGPLAMIERDPLEHGRKIFAAHCMNCHTLDNLGGKEGPDLTQYLSENWLEGFLKDPNNTKYYGGTKFRDMNPLKIPEEELRQLVAFLKVLSQEEIDLEKQPGYTVYQKQDCQSCHGLPGKEAGLVLDLTRFGSKSWIKSFLEDPGQEKFYGESNQMPGFKEILKPEEMDPLIEMLLSLKSTPGH